MSYNSNYIRCECGWKGMKVDARLSKSKCPFTLLVEPSDYLGILYKCPHCGNNLHWEYDDLLNGE